MQTEHVGHGRISEPAGAGRGRGFGGARPRRGWRWMVLLGGPELTGLAAWGESGER